MVRKTPLLGRYNIVFRSILESQWKNGGPQEHSRNRVREMVGPVLIANLFNKNNRFF